MKIRFFSSVLFFSLFSFAQNSTDSAPKNWFNLDQTNDKVNGLGTERVYNELLKGKKSNPVLVGVIDSGVDIDHEDLKSIIWTNPKEIAGNGIDDDNNGYVDDIHGWNFIGGKNGKNIEFERLEMVRIYKKLSDKYNNKKEEEVSDKKEFKQYQTIKERIEKDKKKVSGQLMQINFIYSAVKEMNEEIKTEMKVEKVNAEAFGKYTPQDAKKKQMTGFIKSFLAEPGSTLDDVMIQMEEGKVYLETRLNYNLNADYDQRAEIVGDDENNPFEKNYGNNDVKGPDPSHGTHVSGIIAAVRNNNLGMDGIADNVMIMPVRAVPNGDERDKDVANAIYYAVDNGCQIINMSFGKDYVVHKEAVDKAVKYAEGKGVLLVHAAGNESKNIDEQPNYPTKKAGRKSCKTWIEVGALSWKQAVELPASFSNYGKKSVDVFAPGVDIYSTVPGNKYKNENGTSMACPATAGAAAVLKSYFPQLSAKEIKKILEQSSNTTAKNSEVNVPVAGMGKPVKKKFSELSKTGGYVNLYAAVSLAIKKYSK